MNTLTPIAVPLCFLFCTIFACAQELTNAQKSEFVRQAQASYYSPVEHGFVSISCDVKLDWDTVPKLMLAPAELAGKERLENTRLRLTLHAVGTPVITHEYPADTPALIKPIDDKFFEWVSSVISGFFQTWGSKAMRTPIPDLRHITSLTADQNMYRLIFDGGVPIELTLKKDYAMTQIVTKAPRQTIDEHPEYSSTPQGLLLTAMDATSETGDDTTHVAYEIKYQTVDTIRFPEAIHLVVNDNINMKFSLNACSVNRALLLKVAPPN